MKIVLVTLLMLLVVATSARDWKSGGKGLFMWNSDCFFHANEDEVIGFQPSLAVQCGDICIANQLCNHFSYNGESSICYMIRSGPRSDSDFKVGQCGFIPSRAF
jgi:hypothetical protein